MILEVLQDQTNKINDAARLGRTSTYRRLTDERYRTVLGGFRAGLTPEAMIEITHQEG